MQKRLAKLPGHIKAWCILCRGATTTVVSLQPSRGIAMFDRLLRRVLPGAKPGPIPMAVLVPGRLDRAIVRRALDTVPSTVWEFRFEEPRENVNWHVWRDWHGIPFPLNDRTILVFSASDYPVEGVAGGATGSRCSVAVFGTEDEEVLSLRCWHELLHGLPGIESSDAMLESTAFRAFLGEHYPRVRDAFVSDLERFRHDPRPQRLFYTLLTNTFAARTGRPLVSLPPAPDLR